MIDGAIIFGLCLVSCPMIALLQHVYILHKDEKNKSCNNCRYCYSKRLSNRTYVKMCSTWDEKLKSAESCNEWVSENVGIDGCGSW